MNRTSDPSPEEPVLARLCESRVSVVYDPVDNSRWRLLRAVPALRYLGVVDVTYPTTWRQIWGYEQYDYLDFAYRHLSELGPDDDQPEELCIVTNGHYETETTHSVSAVIERYTHEGSLVVVTDDRRFTPVGGQRPLDQEPFADRIGDYDRVFDAFERRYERFGHHLPLSDTRNLFVQDNALLYELVEGEPPRTTVELFEALPDAPYLPLYDTFAALFSRPEEYGTAPLDSDDAVDDVSRWLRRRVELDRGTAREIVAEYNRRVGRDGKTFDPAHANQMPALKRGRDAADRLRADASPVDARLHGWLTRSLTAVV
ncbi:hypothetical protein [Halobaculum sp. MBLA0143]|uniref:hypothetical protein n=1 Tax=Halobaculum sp. MBLA0143 TaxID=3079933 RepID=UPI00352534CA